ncbi:MAG: hypothetical protein LBQ22_01450, partial [Bacteroidales bacterium]|nr:hypothetical protein [Bacteroidales bacterium]
MKTKLLILIIFLLSGFSSYSQVFSGDLPGIDSFWTNDAVTAYIEDLYNDGDSILHITGVFRKVNNIDANKICSWDGSEIIFYGSDTGIDGFPNCVQMYNDTLYIGGQFYNYNDPSRNYLTIWNGESWQGSAAGQPRGPIWDMCLYNGKLCIAGNFTYIGEQNYGRIALYDGAEWENIGDLGTLAYAVESFNGDLLYAGGHYSYGIKKYLGGTDWETFEDTPNDFLFCLKADTFNTFLYAGGMFTHMGNLRSRGIVMWDGFKWNSMHYEYGSTVAKKAIAIYRGDVYTGNNFTYDEATDTYNYFIARWDGESWDSIGGNFNSTIGAIEVFRDEIYIGGYFRTYNGGQRNKGLVKLTMPDNGCNYIKPRINTFADTVYLGSGASTGSATAEALALSIAEVSFFNNNPYV